MPRARANGELCTRFVQSLETGEKDSFVPLVTSHEHVAEMWEVTFRYKVERDALVEQQRALEAELNQGTEIALVLEVLGDATAIVLKRGVPHRVSLTLSGDPEQRAPAYPGSALVLDRTDHFALASLGEWRWASEIGRVNYVLEDRLRASVDVNGREHILHVRQGLGDNGDLAPGARVLCSVADRLIQSPAPRRIETRPYEAQFHIPQGYGLKGIDAAIRARIAAEIVRPLTNGRAPAGRDRKLLFLFAGPTGTGKSYAADQLASLVPGVAMLRRWPADFRHVWFGASEKAVRQVTDEMLALGEKGPVLVILEEGDVFLTRREEVYGSVVRTELSIESEFFRLCDHIPTDRPVAVIVTTNLRRRLEPAVLRRFGTRILEFPYLAPPQVAEVAEHLLSQADACPEDELEELARRATERLCDRTQPLLTALVDGAKREWMPADLVSPSLVASVIASAVNEASDRAACADSDCPPRLDWPTLATHIHRGYLQLGRVINRDNIAEYLPELHEQRVSELRLAWPVEPPVEAYLAA